MQAGKPKLADGARGCARPWIGNATPQAGDTGQSVDRAAPIESARLLAGLDAVKDREQNRW